MDNLVRTVHNTYLVFLALIIGLVVFNLLTDENPVDTIAVVE